MEPYLSVVIPAYNEVSRLPETLEAIRVFLLSQPFTAEVVVVDDGSKDGTAAAVQAMQAGFAPLPLRLIANPQNQGKGAVVRQGMLEANGQYRLFTDADNSTPIDQLSKLLPYLEQYPVVIGSRYLRKDSIKYKQPFRRRLLSRAGNLLIQSLLLSGIKDTQCGFKLFSAEAAEKIFHQQSMQGWVFDVEVLALARHYGLAIKEVPVDWYDATQSKLRAAHAAARSLRDVWKVYRRIRQLG